MTQRSILCLLLAGSLAALATGCTPPGKPREGAEEQIRPEQVLEFSTLYKQNCAACHGANGQNAGSISLNNPTYLAIAGEANLSHAISAGIPGTLMPPFGKAAGGMLTDQQIAALAHGMVTEWGKPLPAGTPAPPAYAATLTGDAVKGEQAFNTFCASCHGTGGLGKGPVGPIVDPAYLALVNDQYLRSNILAGKPESGMPDWSQHTVSGAKQIMTDAEVTDIVAWIASHRVANPGQPYQLHP
jgi:cytochrome c oxidase cbb3-type subunit 3/ubiquinol-cytochrome c reductase cytochrome c subunit